MTINSEHLFRTSSFKKIIVENSLQMPQLDVITKMIIGEHQMLKMHAGLKAVKDLNRIKNTKFWDLAEKFNRLTQMTISNVWWVLVLKPNLVQLQSPPHPQIKPQEESHQRQQTQLNF